MNKLKRLFAFILAAICLSSFAGCRKKTQSNVFEYADAYLFKDGKSEYSVVISENATEPEKFAAEELVRIFYRTTGAELPVINDGDKAFNEQNKFISVGDGNIFKTSGVDLNSTDFNYDGFMIKTIGNTVLLNAKEERAKIYAALEFCSQNLGYEYYAADCEKFVQSDEIRLKKFDLVSVPDFQGRISFSAEVVNDARNRLFLRNNNQGTGWKEEYGTSSYWSSLSDQSMPMQILDATEYYAAHPEWYFVPQEKRSEAADKLKEKTEITYEGAIWRFIKENMQICYHTAMESIGKSGGAFETFVTNLIDRYIAVETDKRFFMLGLADNKNICDCAGCVADNEKYTTSGATIRFINAVAERVEKWRTENCPDREIDLVVFAYLSTQDPPVNRLKDGSYQPVSAEVVAKNNVVIRIAPIESDHYYEFEDKEHNAASARMIGGWKVCASKFAIWDYSFNFTYRIAPFPSWNAVAPNYAAYKEMGVVDVLSQSDVPTANRCFGKLDDYVRSKLLWDSSLNYESLAYDFIDNYYGEAAPYIAEYYDYLQLHYKSFIEKQSGFSCLPYDNLQSSVYWPQEVLLNIKSIFQRAYEKISELPEDRREVIKDRVDTESQFYRYQLIEYYGRQLFTESELKNEIDEFAAIKNPITFVYKTTVTPQSCVKLWREKYGVI